MWKIVLALFIGALIADAVWCRLEIYRLRGENLAAISLVSRTQETTSKFESSLISCRSMVDSYVAAAQQDVTRKLMTDVGMYHYLKNRKSYFDTKIAKTLPEGALDGILQAQQ